VCVCVCVRACVRAYVRACEQLAQGRYLTAKRPMSQTHIDRALKYGYVPPGPQLSSQPQRITGLSLPSFAQPTGRLI